MQNLKPVLAAVLALLVLIVVLQNTASVETRLLFVTFSMPRALLLIVMLLVGFVLGLIAARRLGRKPGEAKVEDRE